MRAKIFIPLLVVLALSVWVALERPPRWWFLVALVAVLFLIAVYDVTQRRHAVLRNFPLIGHFRYLMELVRPEINQYFVESNTDGMPFNRNQRSVVYQRAKQQLDTLPFGTQLDVYAPGYEWISHSMYPKKTPHEEPRVVIGEGTCQQPYAASHFNISAVSFGSLSKNAILALNRGAKEGHFFHNTGEGGVSPHHLEPGGDLVWQIGTGYFGCRAKDGGFDAERYVDTVGAPSVKMVELKLSQGAKPGHGGILPARKVTAEIAAIRGVPMGQDVLSPPHHQAFDSPEGCLEFVATLRELNGGRPVGIKMCVGNPQEIYDLCAAMRKTGLHPDFFTVDGGEGGTGAAPLEFSNSVGSPLVEGLVFVHNVLRGFGQRDKVRVIASGKMTTGFHVLSRLALGADLCSSARGMMMALGCIQALRCNSNHCPVGVATQNPALVQGLDVTDKGRRVANYHRETIEALLEIIAAAGLDSPQDLRRHHVHRRVSPTEVRSFADIYQRIEIGALADGKVDFSEWAWPWTDIRRHQAA